MSDDTILIWGAGAIGGILGAYLARAGHPVHMVDIVADPESEITLEQARADYDPEAEIGDEFLAKLPQKGFGRIGAQGRIENCSFWTRVYWKHGKGCRV